MVAVLVALEGVRRVLPDSSKPTADPHGPELVVDIAPGSTAVAIGQTLEDAGVVEDGERFRNYAKEQGEGDGFQAGTYRFRAGSDYDRIIERLNAGPPPPRTIRVVIPEGYRASEIAESLAGTGISSEEYLQAVERAQPPPGFGEARKMEGFLFPATYEVRPGASATSLVNQQVSAFESAFSQVDMSYAESKNLTPYDVVKIASMVEREARVQEERPLVAAVIYNRLRLDMTLGIDATLLYEQGSWDHELTVSELEANTPYNTRVRPGLPPTPICNPGLASLLAAARPAKVDHLYYVAEGDSGRHYFTDDYEDFLAHANG